MPSFYTGFLYDFLLGFDSTFALVFMIVAYVACYHREFVKNVLNPPQTCEKEITLTHILVLGTDGSMYLEPLPSPV